MIEVEHAFKSFDRIDILKDISLSVHEGEFFGIIGPNGSGKTTLLHTISGVEPLTSGTIHLDGKSLSSYTRKALARWVGFLQQEGLPRIRYTVREVIEMGRYPFQNWLGYESYNYTALVDSVLERLDLTDMADRLLDQLSGGELQRVALGQVMVQQPRLLLLDEPTTFLDIGYQIQMMDAVRSWQQSSKLTAVAVLHDLNLAAQFCDRILVMHKGKVYKIGTPEEVLNHELIYEVYGTEPIIVPHPISQRPQILLSSHVEMR